MPARKPALLKVAVEAIEDLKGQAVQVLDVRRITTIADHLVICTGTSNRHVSSIAENVIRDAKASGHRPRGVEGLKTGDWVLVDLGDVIVHVMQAQARAYYQLEKLWDAGPEPRSPAKKPAAKKVGKKKAKRRPAKSAARGKAAAKKASTRRKTSPAKSAARGKATAKKASSRRKTSSAKLRGR